MMDHCKMNEEDIYQYSDFYDFSPENQRIIEKYNIND